MLLAVVVSIYFIKDELSMSWGDLTNNVISDSKSKIFNFSGKQEKTTKETLANLTGVHVHSLLNEWIWRTQQRT